MLILSYILNILGTCAITCALLSPGKKIKQILFFNFLGSFIVATGYLFAGNGINGAISVYIGAFMAIVNFAFQSKQKPIPMWLIVVYGIAFTVMNFIGGFTWLAALAVVASLTCVVGLAQNNGASYRIWTLANAILWCAYDVFSKSYAGLIPHVVMLVFTLVGMLVHDRKVKK